MEKSKITLKSNSSGTYVVTDGEIVLVERKPGKPNSPAGCVSLLIMFVLVLTMCWVYSLLPGSVALAW